MFSVRGISGMAIAKTVIFGTWIWSTLTGESVLGALHHLIPGQDKDDQTIGGAVRFLDRSSWISTTVMIGGLYALYTYFQRN